MLFWGVVSVVSISILIFSFSAIYLSLYMPLLYADNQIAFWIVLLLFLFCLITLLISYYRAAFSSPGHPTSEQRDKFTPQKIENFKQNAQKSKKRKQERRKLRNTYPSEQQFRQLHKTSYCEQCDVIKLPRVHHCSICKRCINRMDHHCPWVGTCVGKQNHKFFLLFLFYISAGLGVMWISIAIDLFNQSKYFNQLDQIPMYMLGIVGVVSAMLFLVIFMLFVTQCVSVSDNLTTLETFIQGIFVQLPFDKKNWKLNFQDIFGSGIWVLPTRPCFDDEDTLLIGHESEPRRRLIGQ